jgi:ppGpp synthetase/RelA/SpoT-type nucleotidyltranferase
MDKHCEAILGEYRKALPDYGIMQDIVLEQLEGAISESGLAVNAVAARIKAEESLAGKLDLKGQKYRALADVTDILGARVVTYFADDVDEVARLIESVFEVDWENSIDKRAVLDPDRFGYLSLHYVCRIPKAVYHNAAHPNVNVYRFEIQLRSVLQHVWAEIQHDLGYKSSYPLPKELTREFNRLAGLLEIADEEFENIRGGIEEYCGQVRRSLKDRAALDGISLNEASYDQWLTSSPFEPLVQRIASVNGADVERSNPLVYLDAFRWLGKGTLGDMARMLDDDSDLAFEIAHRQMQGRDIDIFFSGVALLNLCVADVFHQGGDAARIEELLEMVQGRGPRNARKAERLIELCGEIERV